MKFRKILCAALPTTILLLSGLWVEAQNFPEMIDVEGGTFMMGSDVGTRNADEQPLHSVAIGSFKMAKTETTVLQWKIFCNATGRQMPPLPSWGAEDNYPIANVTWSDAVAYAEWLTDKTGTKYRLPTEAEWEFAARGGVKTKCTFYSGSQSAEAVAWFDAHGKRAHSVATKKPNELGLYDMSGNVWEWCLDWYAPYGKLLVNENPTGPARGTARVLRGGSWGRTSTDCTVTYRGRYSPDFRDERNGFRVVSVN